MRCWKLAQTKESIRSGNKMDEELEFHIRLCPECRSLVNAAQEEEKVWTELLYSESLPDGFTESVMASLEQVEIEPSEKEELPHAVSGKRSPQSRPLMKSTLWVASFLIITMALTLFAQPSIADWVRSIFSRETSDSGMLDARSLGLVQNPHIKVEDQGYTIEINEVIADATRLVIGVKVTDPQGEPAADQIAYWENIRILDQGGEEVAQLRESGGSNSIDKLTFIFTREVQEDQVNVVGQINKIGNSFSKKVVNGNWNFNFKLDMRKANALNITTPLHEQYTTPDGMQIEMEKLVRSPSGVILQLSTSLSPEAAKRSPGDLESQQKLMFHFEDEKGEDISSVNNNRSGHVETIISQSSEVRDGKRYWTYTFRYLPYDRQKLKFVFDGYSIPVKSNGSVELIPSQLKEHPVVFKDQGDVVTLSGFTVGPDPNARTNDSNITGMIEMRGEYRNEFSTDAWFVKDQYGKEYPAMFRGSLSWGEIKEASGDPGFVVQGMTELPEKATLIRTVTDKWYPNVNWSFDLPMGKPIPGLEDVDPQKYWDMDAP